MEDVEKLQADLATARADAERLAEQLADREAYLAEQTERTAALHQQVDAARQETAQLRTTAANESRALTDRYRVALVESAPDVPPDLIRGDSAEELDRSLLTAREVVARVKAQAQAQVGGRIPAGSPVRGAPSYGALTPAELIRAGIQAGQ